MNRIDRIAPTVRPSGQNAGTQRWESLVFLHWQCSAAELRAHVPSALEIDTFSGRAYIGVVPFCMRKVRPVWLPKFLTFDFLETNVRTYVTHKGRPGVYFFSLDANFRPAVWFARAGWSLPYQHASMNAQNRDGVFTYQSARRGGAAGHRSVCKRKPSLGESVPGSLEHFLLERYLLFVEHRGAIYSGAVHHTPYPVDACEVMDCQDDLMATAGLTGHRRPPDLAHFSPGVDVEVFAIREC